MNHPRWPHSVLMLLSSLAIPACQHDSNVGSGTGPASSTGALPPDLTSSSSETDPDHSPTTSSSGATTDLSGTTSGGPTTGLIGTCGDAVLDLGEECDKGLELNDANAFCTDLCRLNICGDGLLLVGHEICDEGESNSDAYGSLCTKTCHPGPRCGDNVLQAEHEECDHGPDNDTLRGDEQGIACDKDCRMKAHRGFITSVAFTGELGGLDEADERCRALAEAAGLDDFDRFVAFLSDSTQTVQARYASKLVGDFPYVLVTGQKFADSYAQLIDEGPGDGGISRTETGEALIKRRVATNLAVDAAIHVDLEKPTDCDGWTSADPALAARVGFNAVPADDATHAAWKSEKRWISDEDVGCGWSMHLYCLEL